MQEMGESLDWISNLPQEVIGEILKCLLIRDAVKTSILLKATQGMKSAPQYETHFWKERLRKEDVLYHLKSMTLRFTGLKHELRFTQFILLNAVVLETFDIIWEEEALLDSKKYHVVRKMMQYQRASSKVKVTLNDQYRIKSLLR